MLMVTSSKWMLYRVHSHTPNFRPTVSLWIRLVVLHESFQYLGCGQLSEHSYLMLGKLATIAHFFFKGRNCCTFGHLSNWHYISYCKCSLFTTVDRLSSVVTFNCNKCFGSSFVFVRILKLNLT